MKKILTHFSRLFVGILFIISGLIKLNDPIGFSYKLVEYFSEPVFNLPFLDPIALPLALFLVILEVVLGVFLLIGYKNKFTVWSLLLLTVLFSFLTFYSAYFDVVKDCGCFGDAIKLTPWGTFTKDIVLLVFIMILYFNLDLIKPIFNTKIQTSLVVITFALCCFMGYWVLNHLPLVDFRPFKVGNNINKEMNIPDGAPKNEVEMVFIYDVNGVKKEFLEKDLMSLPEGAKFVDRVDRVIKEGYVPPIHDFTMEKEGVDYIVRYLRRDRLMMIVAYDLSLADHEGMKKMVKLNEEGERFGYKVIGMTGSTPEQAEITKKKYGLKFDFYHCDATTLKTIERANPSIVIISKGVVKQKVHHNDIDKIKFSDSLYSY